MTKPVHTPTQCVKRLPQNSGPLQTSHETMLYIYNTSDHVACLSITRDSKTRSIFPDN